MCACSVAQSCLTLCYPIDCSPPGPSVHGVHQAKTQGIGHTGFCPLPGRLPSSLGLLLSPAQLRPCFTFAVESLCPRDCCFQRRAYELWQVSKVEDRVMVLVFQQKRLKGKGLLLYQESCSFCFLNPYVSTPIPPTISTTG